MKIDLLPEGIEIKKCLYIPGQDHINEWAGLGFGYVALSTKAQGGRRCMIRCYKCGRENYAMVVNLGMCFACGYNPNSSASELSEETKGRKT